MFQETIAFTLLGLFISNRFLMVYELKIFLNDAIFERFPFYYDDTTKMKNQGKKGTYFTICKVKRR